MKAVNPTADDWVVFLGDYVDKGPNVRQTLDLLIAESQIETRIFLRGNHDQMFLNAKRDRSDYPMWECLAGQNPLRSYGNGSTENEFISVPSEHFYFLEKRCVDFYETDDYIFVHAGIRAHKSADEEKVDRLQWSSLGLTAAHLSGKTVICGHTDQPSMEIADLGHTICIDTGISKNGRLTCLCLSDMTFTQVDQDGNVICHNEPLDRH